MKKEQFKKFSALEKSMNFENIPVSEIVDYKETLQSNEYKEFSSLIRENTHYRFCPAIVPKQVQLHFQRMEELKSKKIKINSTLEAEA